MKSCSSTFGAHKRSMSPQETEDIEYHGCKVYEREYHVDHDQSLNFAYSLLNRKICALDALLLLVILFVYNSLNVTVYLNALLVHEILGSLETLL